MNSAQRASTEQRRMKRGDMCISCLYGVPTACRKHKTVTRTAGMLLDTKTF